MHRLKEHIDIRQPENFQPYTSKVAIATAAESWKHVNEINNFCHPVTLAWFSIQILVNSKIFILSLNLSFTHLRAQIAFKGDLSSIMLKERFNDSLKILEFTRICMENHASVTGWQKLFLSYKCFQLSAAVAIATFEIYG